MSFLLFFKAPDIKMTGEVEFELKIAQFFMN